MAQRLSSQERARIGAVAQAGASAEETARRLCRHRSTVYRELRRGGGAGSYGAEAAQAAAEARAARPKTPKLAADAELAAAVSERLAMRWSPHAVCADSRARGCRISAETICTACYDHTGRRGLPEGSRRLLPRRCRRRKPRPRPTRKPSPLGGFKPIADRPAAVEDRCEAGHWEGGLIIGEANRSAVAQLTERLSRHTPTVALPDGYDAPSTAAAVTAALARQPARLVKTLTWDQGREMARWADIEQALGVEVYFCDPHSPWQRATNEHTNGLLRRRYDLDVFSDEVAVRTDSVLADSGVVRGLMQNMSQRRFARHMTVSVGDNGWGFPLTVQPGEVVPFEIEGYQGPSDPESIRFEVSAQLVPEPDPRRSFHVTESPGIWADTWDQIGYLLHAYPHITRPEGVSRGDWVQAYETSIEFREPTSHPSVVGEAAGLVVKDLRVYLTEMDGEGRVLDVSEMVPYQAVYADDGSGCPVPVRRVDRNSYPHVVFLPDYNMKFGITVGGAHDGAG